MRESDISKTELIERGFYLATTIESSGVEEYRLQLDGCLITYFYKVVCPPIGLNDVYIHYPDGSTKGFKKPVTNLSELD